MPLAEIEQEQDALIEEFSYFDDWMDRYRYLIELGKSLPDLSEEDKKEGNLVRGCQSQVWLTYEKNADKIVFRAASDAAIVSGLIAIVLRVYSNRYPADILAAPPRFITEIGLGEHLSVSRNNGLSAMLERIKLIATREQNLD